MPHPSSRNIGANISHYVAKGRPRKQAVAIALSQAREAGVKVPNPSSKLTGRANAITRGPGKKIGLRRQLASNIRGSQRPGTPVPGKMPTKPGIPSEFYRSPPGTLSGQARSASLGSRSPDSVSSNRMAVRNRIKKLRGTRRTKRTEDQGY